MKRKKSDILILTQQGSFDILGKQLGKFFARSHDLRIENWQKTNYGGADIVIVLWWHSVARGVLDGIKPRLGTIGAVFDFISWATPSTKRQLAYALERFDLLVVGNEQILDALREQYKRLPPVFICETGADLSKFKPSAFPKNFNVGWCGNSRASSRDVDIKGIGLIKEACELASVPLQIADQVDEYGPLIQHKDMPSWYSQISVYAIASQCEGTPRTLLEAMASGRPVVSTRTGLAQRLIQHGLNGVIVKRTAKGIAQGIEYFKNMIPKFSRQISQAARISAEGWAESMSFKKWEAAVKMIEGGMWWKRT